MGEQGGDGGNADRGEPGSARAWLRESGEGARLGRARRRRLATSVAAALGVALVAAGYGAWHWHGREWPGSAARLIEEGRYRAAIAALHARLVAAPGDARLHYYLGLAYAGADVPAGAINQLREAVRLDPRRASYHVALGEAYRDAGDLGRARGELQEAVRLDPTEPRYEAGLASLMLDQGQIDDALAHLRHAVGRLPRDPELRLLLAEALREVGDREGMTREYREVIRLASGRPLAEAARQQLRAGLGTDARRASTSSARAGDASGR